MKLCVFKKYLFRVMVAALALSVFAFPALAPAFTLDDPPNLVGKWQEVQTWCRSAEKGAFHTKGGPGVMEIVKQEGRTVYGRTTWENEDGSVGEAEFSGVISAGNDRIYGVEHDFGFKFIELRDGKMYQYYLESKAAGARETAAWFTEFERVPTP